MLGINFLMKVVRENDSVLFSRLDRKWFEDIELDLYDFINNFFIRYKKLPSEDTILKHFDITYNISEPYEYYLDKLKERVVRNKINENVDKMNEMIENSKYDKLLDTFRGIIEESNRIINALNRNIKDLKEIISLSLDELLARRVTETGIPTGWRTLDYATGGLQNGTIFLVVARVKMGKTLILLRMANTAYNFGKKVLFISMEMTAKEIGLRLAGLRLGLNVNMLQRNPVSSFTERIIRREIESLRDNFYFVDGQFTTNIKEIIGIVETYQPDVVYIDGGYLIKPNSKSWKSKWEMISDVIENLKTLAMRFNIPIAISYQFNRDVKRTTTSVTDKAFEKIQLSDAISQIVNTGIAILNNDDIPNTRKIEIIGGRGGEQGEFIINWDWERMNFNELEEGNYGI